MQKKVIALAVAALASGAAMAQSNVTVYGIADVVGTVFNTSNQVAGSLKNQRGFDDGAVGSRVGFKGVEELGNGLKAEFNYELGIAPTNNINASGTSTVAGTANTTTGAVSGTAAGTTLNNLNTRTAWVGLTSNTLGQIAMGRFHSLGWEFQAGSRPWGGLDPIRTASNVYGGSINTSDRISNAFQYTTPSFAGLVGRVQYSADSRATLSEQNTNDQVYVGGTTAGRQAVGLAGVRYDNGPIAAQAIYRKAYKAIDAATDAGKNEWGVRGSYDFQVVKVGALYQRQHLMVTNAAGLRDAYSYGGFVTVPFGSSFLLTLEAAKSKGDQGIGGSGYMLNGQYLFSKRTSVYAQAGYMKMNTQNTASVNLGSYGSTGIEAGQHLTGFMAGILHSF